MVRKAITHGRPSSADLTRIFDECFVQVEKDLKTGVSGPETLRRLLWCISSYFDHTVMGMPCIIGFRSLSSPSHDFVRAFRVVVSGITGSKQVRAPSMSPALEVVCRGVMN